MNILNILLLQIKERNTKLETCQLPQDVQLQAKIRKREKQKLEKSSFKKRYETRKTKTRKVQLQAKTVEIIKREKNDRENARKRMR